MSERGSGPPGDYSLEHPGMSEVESGEDLQRELGVTSGNESQQEEEVQRSDSGWHIHDDEEDKKEEQKKQEE